MLFTGYYINSMGFIICYTTWTIFGSLEALLRNSNACHQNLSYMLSLCNKIGAPIKTELRTHYPSYFSGHCPRYNHHGGQYSSERKSSLLTAINLFRTSKKCTKRELLSMIGKLSFACKVVPTGRIFLHRLIDLSCSVSKLHHHIRITNEARLDLLLMVV